jgi:hypothetical protein
MSLRVSLAPLKRGYPRRRPRRIGRLRRTASRRLLDDSQAVVAEATAPPNLEAATGDAWIAVAPAANGHAMDAIGITDDGEDQSEHHDLVDSLFAELSW